MANSSGISKNKNKMNDNWPGTTGIQQINWWGYVLGTIFWNCQEDILAVTEIIELLNVIKLEYWKEGPQHAIHAGRRGKKGP